MLYEHPITTNGGSPLRKWLEAVPESWVAGFRFLEDEVSFYSFVIHARRNHLGVSHTHRALLASDAHLAIFVAGDKWFLIFCTFMTLVGAYCIIQIDTHYFLVRQWSKSKLNK